MHYVLAGCSPADQPTAETGRADESAAAITVYTNGRIYTVNDSQPWAEAVAIKDGKFTAIGSADDMSAVIGAQTEVIDLKGAFVMPGLHDIHLHIQNAYTADALEGKLLFIPGGIESVDELEGVIRENVEANPDLKVLVGENLPYTLFPDNHPRKEFLDAIVDDRPFYLMSETQHEALLNSKAIEAEGFTADTPNPELGEIMKDPKTGEPTGFLKEQAIKATLAYGNSVMPPRIRSVKRPSKTSTVSTLTSRKVRGTGCASGTTTASERRARCSIHTAFHNPLAPPDAPARESMESRLLVFF